MDTGLSHQPKHRSQQGGHHDQAERRSFEGVQGIVLERHAVEAKALLDPEVAQQVQGQVGYCTDQGNGQHQAELIQQGRGRRGQGVVNPAAQTVVQGVQPTQERPAQQHGCFHQHDPTLQLCLGTAVVRSPLVVGQAHPLCKRRRYLCAVALHMANLASQQDQAQHGLKRHERGKGPGQHRNRARREVFIHGFSVGLRQFRGQSRDIST